MKKYFPCILIAFLFTVSCKHDAPKPESASHSVEFVWKGDTLGSTYYPNSAILIPVEPERACTRKTYLQFQAGVDNNMIYSDFARELGESGEEKSLQLKGTAGSIALDSLVLTEVQRYFTGEDTVIGSMSFDAFPGQNVLIDFVNNTLNVDGSLVPEDGIEAVTYEVYLEKKILVPVTMGGKPYKFLLSPQSPLYVIFNKTPEDIIIGRETFTKPESQFIDDANPAFDGILGYAFLKDKKLWVNTEDQLISIFVDRGE